jgi:hypothetical protein
MRFFVVVLSGLVFVTAGCSSIKYHEDGSSEEIMRLRGVIGLTVEDALKTMGYGEDADPSVFDEPPGIARGVDAQIPSGQRVFLYTKTNRVLNEKRDWPIKEFMQKKVIGVKEGGGGMNRDIYCFPQ